MKTRNRKKKSGGEEIKKETKNKCQEQIMATNMADSDPAISDNFQCEWSKHISSLLLLLLLVEAQTKFATKLCI